MLNFIRRLFCLGSHEWEYSETHNIKECRKCEWTIELECGDESKNNNQS